MLMGVEKAAKEQERMKFPFNGPAFTSLSNGRLCKIILSILPKPLFQKKLSGQPNFCCCILWLMDAHGTCSTCFRCNMQWLIETSNSWIPVASSPNTHKKNTTKSWKCSNIPPNLRFLRTSCLLWYRIQIHHTFFQLPGHEISIGITNSSL